MKKFAREVRDEAKETAKDVAQGAACEANSFVPGTRVLMADGSTNPIEKVKVGDKVVATDPKTGRTSVQTATATITGKGTKQLVKVTLSIHDGSSKSSIKTTTITATAGHPFWVPSLREWIDAGELKPGQWLQTSSGTWVQVGAVKAWTAAGATVHNLTVTDAHTFYVLAGAEPLLTHNCDGTVYWVNENAHMSPEARAYDDGAAGSRAGLAPALQYYLPGRSSLSQVKFDGFDASNGVLIDRKLAVTTRNKTYLQAIRQSVALEQNGYSGRWEVPTEGEARRARRVLGSLLITNIRVKVVPR
ncbi:polymorphic toxin-type HINT domain-containing protein [Streptomyces sp. D2-8]|uniref:polymorphic toxin-type HINT domain-containing protein n=1 Tax=Streptomyces sp. D2-8 TaxID=2707767 RepID=UPI0027E449EA|nr:polymorphic toxin-type HINT domain-containing protein [Streptomyces sp. D2-8]